VRLPTFSAPGRLVLALSAAAAAATACRPESPVSPSSGEYALVSAVVYGRVLTAAGAPVPDVTVGRMFTAATIPADPVVPA
jgi:hypothetical protein